MSHPRFCYKVFPTRRFTYNMPKIFEFRTKEYSQEFSYFENGLYLSLLPSFACFKRSFSSFQPLLQSEYLLNGAGIAFFPPNRFFSSLSLLRLSWGLPNTPSHQTIGTFFVQWATHNTWALTRCALR